MPDNTLIRQLQADDYGMKQFTLVLLKKGPATAPDPDSRAAIRHLHLKYMRTQFDNGKLLCLGPLLADADTRGICIYNCSTEEARTIAESDPALQAGYMVAEVHPWYSMAALQQIPDLHKQIEIKSFADIQ